MRSANLSAAFRALETARGNRLLAYVTSVRWNLMAVISDDALRVFSDHLLKIRSETGGEKLPALDLFLVSNGGESTVTWKLISELREFAEKIYVLVPYRAYSAATLIALGADKIVMGPFGQLGPIDPQVQNDYNPVDPATQQRIGISVEDVRSYIAFVKRTVGITHEDELVQTITALTQQVHPLALGNVERFLAQSRMIATKLLKTHMPKEKEHVIAEIVEDLASSNFHGHPIGRKEAVRDLQLQVEEPDRNIESLMWQLYLEYEKAGEMNKFFDPAVHLAKARIEEQEARRADYSQTVQDLNSQGLSTLQAHQAAEQLVSSRRPPASVSLPTASLWVDSRTLSSEFVTVNRLELLPEQVPGQQQIRTEVIRREWTHSAVPEPGPAPEPTA